MAKKVETKKEEQNVITDIANLVSIIKNTKPSGSKPDMFVGILLKDKIEKRQRGIRVFIKTDDKTYPVAVSSKDLVDLFDNGFFGKQVKVTRSGQRSYNIELA